jgi:phosphoribosylglycinamide formyltransferase-1
VTSRIVVLASGSGTLLQALIDAPDPAFEIVGVISDRADAAALGRAEAAGITASVVAADEFSDRATWDNALADALREHGPDWVVCAGFMRILGAPILETFAGRIVNSHPALLPAFPGAHGVASALDYGVKLTGCTVHLVDAGVDTGPILAQEALLIDPDDDEASLHERIKTIERRLLLDIVNDLCRFGCTVSGRKVTIP